MRNDQTFGQFFRAARLAAGLTAAQLAEKAGLNQSQISNWEADKNQPSLPLLRKIAPMIGIPVLELAVRAGHMTQAEAKLKDLPKPPEPVRRGISTDGLDPEQERLLADMAEQLRRQNPKA